MLLKTPQLGMVPEWGQSGQREARQYQVQEGTVENLSREVTWPTGACTGLLWYKDGASLPSLYLHLQPLPGTKAAHSTLNHFPG